MDHKHAYHSVSHHYSTKMMRTSLAVGVVWGVASLCLAIITGLVFIQDQWIGDTEQSKGPGNFGLWRWCSDSRDGRDICRGQLDMFSSLLSPAFQSATIFTGLSVLGCLLALLAWVLFCCCRSAEVFKVCGCLQIMSGVFLLVAILSFPAGWDNSSVVGVCGPEADDFELGTCGFRWTYLLAVVACCDAFLLGILALTLGCKVILVDSSLYPGDGRQGYLMENMELAAEIKSQQPVMMGDRYSDFSQNPLRGSTPYSQSNFQL
eukprot:GFUD01011531.1.p1 GENE.GFUD01011531.1~~GFUD01011531.1.p1  ORF type:complete len:263 (+),score=47.73 GFUD01011531.1:363-1151(+)